MWPKRKATFLSVAYTAAKIGKCGFYMSIRNAVIAYFQLSAQVPWVPIMFWALFGPEDTMKSNQILFKIHMNTTRCFLVKYQSTYSKEKFKSLKKKSENVISGIFLCKPSSWLSHSRNLERDSLPSTPTIQKCDRCQETMDLFSGEEKNMSVIKFREIFPCLLLICNFYAECNVGIFPLK